MTHREALQKKARPYLLGAFAGWALLLVSLVRYMGWWLNVSLFAVGAFLWITMLVRAVSRTRCPYCGLSIWQWYVFWWRAFAEATCPFCDGNLDEDIKSTRNDRKEAAGCSGCS
jgi:hypothetical protein